jgi:hypothetical protein
MPSTTTDRTWTETGAQLFDAERANREGHGYAAGQNAVAAAIDALSWVEIPPSGSLDVPFTPGHGIQTMLTELGLRGVRRVAWNGSVPVRDDVERSSSLYGLYGIEAPERGGLLRVFVVDRGVDLLVVAYDRVTEAPEGLAGTAAAAAGE